jgi:glycosyltransferase involved in cell wall biosynthesis
MLAPEFLPVWGGVGTYIVEIAKNVPKDVEVHVVTPKRTGFGNQIIEVDTKLHEIFPENVHIHYLGKAKDTFIYNFTFQLNCWRHIYSMIKEYDIDIIHSSSAMPDLFISPKKVGVPIVTTIHTTTEGQANTIKSSGTKFSQLEFSEKMTLFLSHFLKFLEDRYYNSNGYYLTVSEWAKKQIIREKKIDAGRIEVIHNGVDSDEFNPYKKKEAKNYFPELSEISCPKILFLSRLIGSKGIRFLLKAVPKILEKVDAHFIFAGAGMTPSLNISKEDYTFLGYVPHEKTPYLYALSDIFILPSLSENFPISILEAMSSELAVIATNVGGIPEMITHGEDGFLIQPMASEDIVNSVVTLIRDGSLRREIGNNARENVKKKFNWENTVVETKRYYEEVLENETFAR